MTRTRKSAAPRPSLSACTIVSRNYLSHARILAESFHRHEPAGRFYLLVVDKLPAGVELPEYVELVQPEELELPYLYEMCFKYDVTELSTAVKPTLLAHLMERRGETRLAYLDPDILVQRPLDELQGSLRRAAIVLVPHLLDQIPLDGRRPNEQDILIAGSYNLGFLALRRHADSARLLAWWEERLRDLCRVSPSEGLMTDQRWIDLVPGLFPSSTVLRDDTYDVAYWNLHSRTLERRDGQFTVNGRPIAFFHYSGFDPTRPLTFSKHQDRFDVAEHPALRALLAEYAALHEVHHHAQSSAWEYGYSRFSNGIAVHPVLRRLYLGLDDQARASFGDPFDADGERSFLGWATEPRGEELSLFLANVYRLRYDVAAAFPDVDGRDREAFIHWARTTGASEERYDAALVRTAAGRESIELDRPSGPAAPAAEPGAGAAQDLSGVNVVAYLRSESGLGAAARGYIRALSSGSVPMSLVDIGHLTVNRNEDPTITEIDDEFRYGVNLVVVNADEHFHVTSELGEDRFRGRYNIGVWAWELPAFPPEWHDRFPWYDEIWVGTSFIAGALAKVAPMPVVVVPPTLSVAKPGLAARGRKLIGAAEDEFVFAFMFDFHSFFERKNPLALIDAFTRAFSPRDRARLIVKCTNGHVDEAGLAELYARAEGHRVDIHSGYWPAQDVRDLMAGCDAYASLHRAEGTGLTLSDAMAHAKPVIATGWSGNTDFMNAANSYPVDYELVTLERDFGPYAAGGTWADPSVDHAAQLMRRVFDDREEAATRGARAKADIEGYFSEARVAEIVHSRLAVIADRARTPAAGRARRRPATTKGFPDYAGLVDRVRLAIEANTPPEATVAIVSRGDDELLTLGQRAAWHFPRTGDGAYAGYYPTDSDAAIGHLEQLRANGATHLAIPASCGWWLEHYDGLREHLESRCEVVFDDPATVTVFHLSRPRRADLAVRLERVELALAGQGAPVAGELAGAWSSALADSTAVELDGSRRRAEERIAALGERIDEIERSAGALDRRLRVGATWGGTIGETVPAEVARLRTTVAEQVERTARLELLLEAAVRQGVTR